MKNPRQESTTQTRITENLLPVPPPNTSFHDPNRLLRLADVLKIIPVSRSCWWAWVKTGKAPSPIRLGGTTCWSYSDLLAFIDNARSAGGAS